MRVNKEGVAPTNEVLVMRINEGELGEPRHGQPKVSHRLPHKLCEVLIDGI